MIVCQGSDDHATDNEWRENGCNQGRGQLPPEGAGRLDLGKDGGADGFLLLRLDVIEEILAGARVEYTGCLFAHACKPRRCYIEDPTFAVQFGWRRSMFLLKLSVPLELLEGIQRVGERYAFDRRCSAGAKILENLAVALRHRSLIAEQTKSFAGTV